ncbi:MAG: FeoA family protein [bacterium]
MPLHDLTQVKERVVCEIVEMTGGMGFAGKLAAMGITVGTKVKKISSQIMKGPVTIQLGNTQVAIGFGMAKKIIVRGEK